MVNEVLSKIIKDLKAEEQKALNQPSTSENVGEDHVANFYYRVGLNFAMIQLENALTSTELQPKL